MFIALISNATNGLNNDPKNDSKKTTFVINNVKQGNQLTIKDFYGLILYKEQIKDSGNYSKGFDLTDRITPSATGKFGAFILASIMCIPG